MCALAMANGGGGQCLIQDAVRVRFADILWLTLGNPSLSMLVSLVHASWEYTQSCFVPRKCGGTDGQGEVVTLAWGIPMKYPKAICEVEP